MMTTPVREFSYTMWVMNHCLYRLLMGIQKSRRSTHLPSKVKLVASKYLPPAESDVIRFIYIHCDHQTNSMDCGVFAIANMVNLISGIEPAYVLYDKSKMRDHLFACMEAKKLTPFPHLTDEENVQASGRVLHMESEELHCTCKLIDSGYYFECTNCHKWFHPQCQGINKTQQQIERAKNLRCVRCQTQARRGRGRKGKK